MILALLAALALAEPLSLDTVLDAVDGRVPELAAASADLDAARAKALGSRGAFDPKLGAKGGVYGGKDPRRYVDGYVGGGTLYGPSWSAGYRAGVGTYPTYDGSKTADSGEAYARLAVPVLEGLVQGQERAQRDASEHTALAYAHSVDDKRLQTRRKASVAYWKWAASGAKRQIALDLLALATERARVFGREVDEGARARLDLIDNERVLYERTDAVAAADASVAAAAQALSLLYRDANGRPIAPDEDELPSDLNSAATLRTEQVDLDLALQRPDLLARMTALEANDALVAGSRNALLPRLDLSIEHSRALDGSEVETIGGIDLSSSLLLRKERGELDRRTAERASLDAQLRGARDLALAEVLATRAAVQAARRRVSAAQTAVERAREAVALERRRFELGDSELFTLLLREEKLAKSRKALVDAQLAARLAEADLAAVTGQDLSSAP